MNVPPSVVYSFAKTIRNKILSYKETVSSITQMTIQHTTQALYNVIVNDIRIL